MNLEQQIGTGFGSINAIEDLYARYLKDPQSVDPSWKSFFDTFDREKVKTIQASSSTAGGDARILGLINAYRLFGHLGADIDPLASEPPSRPSQLAIDVFGFSSADLTQEFPTFGLLPEQKSTLQSIINRLESIYSGKIGVEFVGICRSDVEKWLADQLEGGAFRAELTVDQKHMIMQYLNQSELFESFLHMKYPGQKRFSLEGAESLIPMLAEIIDRGAEFGVKEIVFGMAHRGRLNVLSNILNKSYVDIFSEFDEGYAQDSFEGTGDVKYHKGYYSNTISSHGHKVDISVMPNPSHLESVDPIVEGVVKAKQLQAGKGGFDKILPVLIHGDASISGQGVVYETLQLINLPGYTTGGTIHVVINNQIGFTTLPKDSRSTTYCTDIAKAFGAPVFHVNGDDPESCFFAALLAIELRCKFQIDVFIDMVCYRKYGHNESDEPAYTQPLVYQVIRKKQPIRELYKETLISRDVLKRESAEKMEQEFKASLQKALESVEIPKEKTTDKHLGKFSDEGVIFKHVNTGVLPITLRMVAEKISFIPQNFKINPKLQKLVKDRFSMIEKDLQKPSIDWGMAELLAYGSLLNEGYDVRLSGQDCCRGTFSHRHAVWVDQETSSQYFPLQHISDKQGRFDAYNSPLSEYAVLGFEFGYSLAAPKSLVIWEAQFGDFSNGAQIVIDQYISTAEQKWGQKSGLVLLLPHGYEGQGPEHSSARIERYLTLAGQNNMMIANPTTPAQFFHLLRRQVLGVVKKPLIVFTPKGLLRHPACLSTLQELAQGSFLELLDDPDKPQNVDKLVFCSGRIFYDLIAARTKGQVENIAIVRIEQLYPLDREGMLSIFEKYKGFKECVWIQEEPVNMGPSFYIIREIEQLLPKDIKLDCIARPRSASPAVGSHALHDKEHQALLDHLFERRQPCIFDLAGKKT